MAICSVCGYDKPLAEFAVEERSPHRCRRCASGGSPLRHIYSKIVDPKDPSPFYEYYDAHSYRSKANGRGRRGKQKADAGFDKAIPYPSEESEFEVQSYLLCELRDLGFDVKGEVTADSGQLDLVVFDEKHQPIRIIEVKNRKTRLRPEQLNKYRRFACGLDVVRGKRMARAYIKRIEENGQRLIAPDYPAFPKPPSVDAGQK